jgi:hypothetical protein
MRQPASLALSAFLAACATPSAPAIERARTVEGSPDAVQARVLAELTRLGFSLTPTATPGVLAGVAGSGSPAAWSDCPQIIVRGGESGGQLSFEQPQSRAVAVRVEIGPAITGSAVAVDLATEATYLNRYRNQTFQGRCTSTGVVERQILDAAAAA